jgi:hypothetical protein
MWKIREPAEFYAWLDDDESVFADPWAAVLCSRIALRVLPYGIPHSDRRQWVVGLARFLFRTNLISWMVSSNTDWEVGRELGILAADTVWRLPYDPTELVEPARIVSDISILAAETASHDAVENTDQIEKVVEASRIARFAYQETDTTGDHFFWEALEADCGWLDRNPEPAKAAYRLSVAELWPRGTPSGWTVELQKASSRLLALDSQGSYQVWIDWYERRIRGERAAFDIPGDQRRVEDKKILRRLAEATDEDFWGKGHEYVNATLKGWLDEARERVAPPPIIAEVSGDFNITVSATAELGQLPSQIIETLQAQASPQAQIIDGKLDAVPNTIFDKPQYSDNLAELPSELMAYAQTIIDSLPSNCPAIVRTCFANFHGELLVRGNRPILNILKGMTASIQAELYIELDTEISPDEWRLRDPREWGPGMGAMFAHFFKGYHDLIHHFPLDSEREELIAKTPIDEVAASGNALTAPVEAVAEEIVKAGERGEATDNFVKIIEAMRLYNRDIAQLPTPGTPSDTVTPKRRHVLMTIGFYVSTLGVLGSAASLYSLPAGTFASLMSALQQAIDDLLKFIL